MQETTSYQKFRSAVDYLGQHLDLIDMSITTLESKASSVKSDETKMYELIEEGSKYKNLNDPVITEKYRILSYSRSQNVEHAICTIYESLCIYLKSILDEIFNLDEAKALQVISLYKLKKDKSEKTLDFVDIVKLGSYEAICHKIVGETYRSLENQRNTPALLDAIDKKFELDIEKIIKDEALLYAEIRHLIVHNSSEVDAKFAQKIRTLIENESKNKEIDDKKKKKQELPDCLNKLRSKGLGDKIPRDYKVARSAIEAIKSLVLAIDQKLLTQGFVKSRTIS
jgi:hypothetical protein